jgi:hypothetical protein
MAGIGFENAPNYKAYAGSFIGRQIGFYAVRHVDLNDGSGGSPIFASESFRLAIQTIQQHAEILFIGTPVVSNAWGSFIVGIAQDTANDGNDTVGNITNNAQAETIQAALRNIPELNNNNDALFDRRWLHGSDLVTTANYLDYIDESNVGDPLPEPLTFAPGSVEQDELNIIS